MSKMAEWFVGCKFSQAEIENQQNIVQELAKKRQTARDYTIDQKLIQKSYKKEAELLSYMEKNPLVKTDRLYTKQEIQGQKELVAKYYQLNELQSGNISEKAAKAQENLNQAEAKLKHMQNYNKELAQLKQSPKEPIPATNMNQEINDKQTRQHKPNNTKTSMAKATLSPELTVAINKKVSELYHLNNSLNQIVTDLKKEKNQIDGLETAIERYRSTLGEAQASVTTFRKNENSLDESLKQKQTAINRINQSFIKKLIAFFTAEKRKLNNEKSTLESDLARNNKQLKSQEKIVNSLTQELQKYQEKLVSISENKEYSSKLNDLKVKTENFKNELQEHIKPYISSQLNQFSQNLNKIIKQEGNTRVSVKKLSEELKVGNNNKLKEMKSLTQASSKQTHQLRLDNHIVDKNKGVSRA